MHVTLSNLRLLHVSFAADQFQRSLSYGQDVEVDLLPDVYARSRVKFLKSASTEISLV